MRGYEYGSFKPDKAITPEQAARVIRRAFGDEMTRGEFATLLTGGGLQLEYIRKVEEANRVSAAASASPTTTAPPAATTSVTPPATTASPAAATAVPPTAVVPPPTTAVAEPPLPEVDVRLQVRGHGGRIVVGVSAIYSGRVEGGVWADVNVEVLTNPDSNTFPHNRSLTAPPSWTDITPDVSAVRPGPRAIDIGYEGDYAGVRATAVPVTASGRVVGKKVVQTISVQPDGGFPYVQFYLAEGDGRERASAKKIRPPGISFCDGLNEVMEGEDVVIVAILDKPWPNETSFRWGSFDRPDGRPDGDVAEARGDAVFPAGHRQAVINITLPDNNADDFSGGDSGNCATYEQHRSSWHLRFIYEVSLKVESHTYTFYTADDEAPHRNR